MFNGATYVIMPPKDPSWFDGFGQSVSLFFWEHNDLIPLLLMEVALAILITIGFMWWERRKANRGLTLVKPNPNSARRLLPMPQPADLEVLNGPQSLRS